MPVVVGGIIPPEDAQALEKTGVAAVYTPKDFELNRIMSDVVRIVEAGERPEQRVRADASRSQEARHDRPAGASTAQRLDPAIFYLLCVLLIGTFAVAHDHHRRTNIRRGTALDLELAIDAAMIVGLIGIRKSGPQRSCSSRR